jgi:hypothetical protein
VAHIVHGLRVGGLENGLINLINRTPRGRYRHAIICLTDYDRFFERIERPDEVDVFSLNKRDGKNPAMYLRLWRLLRQLRPDIVHTRNLAALEAQLFASLAGVPVTVLLVWPAVVYVAYRVAALVVAPGVPAAALAAVLATAGDVFTDPNGVRDGIWRYPESPVSEPRYRGVPWWNFVGWIAIVFLTALFPVVVTG